MKSGSKMAHFFFFFFTQFLSLLLLLSITPLKFCVGMDTLFPDQSIAVGQTLISQTLIFELGFFSPGKSSNYFLGIWYKSTPETVVWVANRNTPIAEPQGVVLTVVSNQTLVIRRGEIVIWSSGNSSSVASIPVLQLLDTGNLVIIDNASGIWIWQSFDYPTDTWLPGMKMVNDVEGGLDKYLTSWRNWDDPSPGDFVFRIENEGLSDMVLLYGGTKKKFRTGKWNGINFDGLLPFPNSLGLPVVAFKEERLISVLANTHCSNHYRLTLESSGVIKRYTLNSRTDKWDSIRINPRDSCDEYGTCGPNAICKFEKPVICECFKGFAPKLQKDWDSQDWSGGCTRIRELNCEGGDGFLEVERAKYPHMLDYWLNSSMSLSECRARCLRNCNCTAYANPIITNEGYGCLMWFGDLVDIRENLAADIRQIIYIRLPASEIVASTNLEEKNKISAKIIVISIAAGVFVSGFVNGEIGILTLTTTTMHKQGNLSGEEEIAVKRLSRSSSQGLEEFKNEVTSIAKLQHRNLVRLLGCCIEGEERMLIYEYLRNKSLDYFVFDQNRRAILTWPKRFDIIMGIARGLLYLHQDSRLKIIHRDLKTSNILLDGNLNPKIADFGLARAFVEDQSIVRTKRVVGTYGYMAPEYAIDGKFSVKSDVFSFGVVLLEIVSGKKNRGFNNHDNCHTLLGHAWLLWKEDKFMELMDESLNETFVESELKRCVQVGLLCVQKFAEDRPVMSSVLFMLGTDGAVLPEPKEPAFFYERSLNPITSVSSPSMKSDNNTMTNTDLEAR
ncbi:PREDICTED: G-type lectin S-receptor-like serine/threonine-protein kinase At4g27290 [Erythranthe guttata]|uniref:G-type lectin S-receptor-like serine/threonine-protein kinase At4g27290 n=1 Tax=Erythranthe guttata TaxID=4155 RepID=UPI00064DBAAF|nr:PREDICTED: G-type lectin S-receptor-like serine/threonine-protein kinase At4g27290 [Erythranthe guttata]|eukprot:XP_012841566.1 PREDICTED: G-type lectin S-receptor-like serine/threonine-protein kinase At4g27290 [Erythranthe guttata]